MIVLPAMPPEQIASWHSLLDIYERLNAGWTLIGGQLAHLHCAERGEFPVRPTNDADTVVDVRAAPLEGREGKGPCAARTSLAALISKAAHSNVGDRDTRRHRRDFIVLATLITASDFRSQQLTKTELRQLRTITDEIEADRELLLAVADADSALDRLTRAAGL